MMLHVPTLDTLCAPETASAIEDAEWLKDSSLDRTWMTHLRGLSPEAAAHARTVPASIGMSLCDDAGWDDFVQLPPNRALPRFVAGAIDRARIARFDLAHHHGAFFGIVADRIADAQAIPTPALRVFRDSLRRVWVARLGMAAGDERLARDVVATDLRAWRAGLIAERKAFATRELSFEAYPAMVIPRLRWISTSAALMVSLDQGPAAAAALRQTYDRFLLACQLRDDAIDESEDRRARGASVPDLLGVPSGALLRAAYVLVCEAATSAHERFPHLARWLRDFAPETNVGIAGQPLAACGFLGAALADAALEATR